MSASVRLEFPTWAQLLFAPKRFKVFYGGRGGGKSWAVARALLIQAAQSPLRVLCTREVQKSIKDSVHRLLSDQVAAMGLGDFYEVLETEIRGKNGSVFLFAGLLQHTIDSIKSFEGVDRVWVEEAHSVSKKSWDVLVPTIRREGSEIWATFNPQLDTDEVFARFVKQERPDCLAVKVNYSENPWFPAVLEAERLHAKATKKEAEYRHIWEGDCLPAVEGAIYFDEVAQAEADGRICPVPYDPLLKVHTVWDLGWNDSTSIILAQRSASSIRVIDYIEGSHRTLADYAQQLDGMKLNWGIDWLPHDAYAKDVKTGKSAVEILRALGRNVPVTRDQIPELGVEDGIRVARLVFPRIYFDKNKTQRLVECLKRYRRHVNQTTNEPGAPLHDEHSHGADAFRYLCVTADHMGNALAQKPINYTSRRNA